MHTLDANPRRPKVIAALARIPSAMLIFLVRLYQVSLGPVMGGHCRFHPTCSQYAIDSLSTHGALRGTWLTIRRLLRCHPLGGFGFDPVPPRAGHSSQSGSRG